MPLKRRKAGYVSHNLNLHKSGMHAVIDGDRYPYQIGFAAQKMIYKVTLNGEEYPRASFEGKRALNKWVKDNDLCDSDISIDSTLQVDSIENTLHSLKATLRDAIEGSGCETYQVYLSGKGNFRDEISTIIPYKSTRNAEKPVHFQAIRDYMIKYWDAIVVDGIECDDKLAIEATKAPEHVIIVSDDKDLNTVPCWRYIPTKRVKFRVSEQDALLWNYSQAIIGDTVDAIPGIPKAGKMAAYKALQDCETEEDMFWATLCAYENSSYEKPLEALTEMMRLLYMKRSEDEPLWSPPV